MGLVLALLLAVSVKDDNTALRSGCSGDAPLVATLPAGTPLQLRYALSGESVPCYKIAAAVGGRQIDGYLPAAAIEGLDSFDKGAAGCGVGHDERGAERGPQYACSGCA